MAGTCNVYAKSHNGTRTRIKVVIKNYARASSYAGTHLRDNDIYALVTDYKTPMQNIAEYYSTHRLKGDNIIRFTLNDEAEVVITPKSADIGNLRKDIETLLVDFPYYISIEVQSTAVEYILYMEDNKKSPRGEVRFWFNNNCSAWQNVQIASHWTARRRYPI